MQLQSPQPQLPAFAIQHFAKAPFLSDWIVFGKPDELVRMTADNRRHFAVCLFERVMRYREVTCLVYAGCLVAPENLIRISDGGPGCCECCGRPDVSMTVDNRNAALLLRTGCSACGHRRKLPARVSRCGHCGPSILKG